MRVWIVVEYPDGEPLGVFSTEELADQYLAECNKRDKDGDRDFEATYIDMDNPPKPSWW